MRTIKARLLFSLCLLVGSIVIVAAFGYHASRVANMGLETVLHDRVKPLRDLKTLSDLYAVDIVDTAHQVRNANMAWEDGAKAVSGAMSGIERAWQAYDQTYMDGKERELASTALARMKDADSAVTELLSILRNRDHAALDRFVTGRLYPAIHPVSDSVSKLVNRQIAVAEQHYQTSARSFALAGWGMLASLALAAISAIIAFRTALFSIVVPLETVHGCIHRLADGDLVISILCLDQHDEIGSLAKAVQVFRDTAVEAAELRVAQKSADQMVGELRTLITESPAIVAMLDQDMCYIAASKRFKEIYRIGGDPIGRSHYHAVPDLPQSWIEAYQRALNGEIVAKDEDYLERSASPPIWLRWDVRPWHRGGSVAGILIYNEDVTEWKQAEIARDAGVRALEISNRELDEFAHIISHDLKEPLRGIRNQANFLLEDFGDHLSEDGRKRLQRMTHLGDRMQKLIEDLLFFSRLGRSQLAMQLADPNEIVRDVEHLLEAMLAERNAKIVMPKPMPPLLCDKPRVTELFRNLITNAVKYNDKEQPLVEIGYEPEVATPTSRERRVYYVKDNGPGIPMEFHQDIFVMFKRLRIDGAAEEEGTGAGLAFVKKIVERHGGRIWLASTLGEGTTFYFTLPQPAIAVAPQTITSAA